MRFRQIGSDLLLTELQNFDPFVSCECGQCFRFYQSGAEEYTLFAQGRSLKIARQNGGWLFSDINEAEFREKFFDYFDLGRDYGAIIDSFSFDKTATLAARAGNGIRIFRQDPFEALISFIISQNNNIPRIKKIIEALCALLGEASNGFYSFPTAEKIAAAGVEGLAPIKSGFRAKYIFDAASKVASGRLDLQKIAKMPYDEAKAELLKIKGVGEKVANCVLLFGFNRLGAFPVDVWVKRVLEKYYPPEFDPTVFGEYAGIAQQYLFYYERTIQS